MDIIMALALVTTGALGQKNFHVGECYSLGSDPLEIRMVTKTYVEAINWDGTIMDMSYGELNRYNDKLKKIPCEVFNKKSNESVGLSYGSSGK